MSSLVVALARTVPSAAINSTRSSVGPLTVSGSLSFRSPISSGVKFHSVLP